MMIVPVLAAGVITPVTSPLAQSVRENVALMADSSPITADSIGVSLAEAYLHHVGMDMEATSSTDTWLDSFNTASVLDPVRATSSAAVSVASQAQRVLSDIARPVLSSGVFSPSGGFLSPFELTSPLRYLFDGVPAMQNWFAASASFSDVVAASPVAELFDLDMLSHVVIGSIGDFIAAVSIQIDDIFG